MRQPWDGGATHQPMGFDQMNALYDHFTVIGSSCKVTVTATTSGEEAYRVGLYKNDDATPAQVGLNEVAENTPSKVRVVSVGQVVPVRMKETFSLKKTYGGGSLINNPRFIGDGSNSPTEMTHFVIALQSLRILTTTEVSVQIEIDYLAVWTELKPVGQS